MPDVLRTLPKPKVVVICGSSRFVDVMAVCAWLIERDEKAITMGLHLLPSWYPNCKNHHQAEHEDVACDMDDLHLYKIDLADEVFVVDIDGYIGESTTREISYAEFHGKLIRMFSRDHIGHKVRSLVKRSQKAKAESKVARKKRYKDCDRISSIVKSIVAKRLTLKPFSTREMYDLLEKVAPDIEWNEVTRKRINCELRRLTDAGLLIRPEYSKYAILAISGGRPDFLVRKKK